MATWWMGIPVGIILSSISIHRSLRTMVEISFKSFLVVLAITLLTGAYGLAEGYLYTSNLPKENLQRWFIPNDLVHYKRFITVGSMHNYSYLGGAFGLVAGVAYVGWRKGVLQLLNRQRTLQKNNHRSQRHS